MSSTRSDHQWLRESPERFGLSLQGSQLYCDGVSLEELAQRFGTPTYVYSISAIQARFRELSDSLKGCDATICYALKANSNQAVISTLAQQGAGADVVSGGELLRVLRAGVSPNKIVFSGVGKRDEELAAAVQAGILSINVESVGEIARVEAVARKLGKKARVSLRLNPDVDPKTHPYLATGVLGSKFGIDMQDAADAADQVIASQGLSLVGLACHIGSMVQDAEPYLLCVDRMASMLRELRSRGVEIEHLDLGGGLGIPYRDGDSELAPLRWGQSLSIMAQSLGVKLVVEPGRYLVGNSGLLLTRAIGTKSSGNKRYLVVDAAMNDLLRPALYNAYHGIVKVPLPSNDAPIQNWEVVGPVCECGDFLAHDRPMVDCESGDLLVVLSAGAYCMTMASNYNSRPLPAEVLVKDGQFSCVRPRQSIEALLDAEQKPRWEESVEKAR